MRMWYRARGAAFAAQEVLRAMLTQADTNGDGYLDRDEFRKWYEGARKKIDQAVEALFKVSSPATAEEVWGLRLI